jgi:hypothetical protein
LDASPVLLRRSVFLERGCTRGCTAIGGVVGRGGPTESLRTKIAANFNLKKRGSVWKTSGVLGEALPSLALGGHGGPDTVGCPTKSASGTEAICLE